MTDIRKVGRLAQQHRGGARTQDDDIADESREAADDEIIEDLDGVHPPFAVSEEDVQMAQLALEKVRPL